MKCRVVLYRLKYLVVDFYQSFSITPRRLSGVSVGFVRDLRLQVSQGEMGGIGAGQWVGQQRTIVPFGTASAVHRPSLGLMYTAQPLVCIAIALVRFLACLYK